MDVARIFCWSMSQLCSHSWLKDGNGNPLPDELFDLLRRCIAYINKIGNKTVTTPAGFFSRLGSSILEPKWAKDVQQLSAAGVTSGKLLLNCWKVSKQTEHHNRRASACSPDFSHQKEQSSNKHHRHHKDIGSLAPATSDLRVFLHGIPSLSRRPPYFHHAVLAADIRYPISRLSIAIHCCPAASVLGSSSNSAR